MVNITRGLGVIDKGNNYVEWALLVAELSEAQEHLKKLIEVEVDADDFDEQGFRIALAHIYSHLNRAWNMRNQTSNLTSEQFNSFAQFPEDIEPF